MDDIRRIAERIEGSRLTSEVERVPSQCRRVPTREIHLQSMDRDPFHLRTRKGSGRRVVHHDGDGVTATVILTSQLKGQFFDAASRREKGARRNPDPHRTQSTACQGRAADGVTRPRARAAPGVSRRLVPRGRADRG